ncbi:MAG TPA: DUF4013 domain-containing protein [Pirellulaceae bacterium]|nr:DUF4013 domain-containing protein [Pirellulaceae bacterium]
MTYPSSDPYATPSALPPKPGMDAPPMRYMEAYSYIFAHPEWTTNVLLAAVCSLIPVVGNIVLLGYQYEIIEAMHRFPGQLYPKFDFNRFSQYLMRGVWPFLVNLIVGVVIQIPIQCGNFTLMGLSAAAGGGGGEEAAGVALGLGFLVFMLFVIVLSVVVTLAMIPLLLRAGLSQEFGQAFKFAWIQDFIAKTWLEMLLTVLFLIATGSVAVFIGLLACCIGIIPAAVIIMMASAHLVGQLYTIFLARGGEPIPLKPWEGPAPMVPPAM